MIDMIKRFLGFRRHYTPADSHVAAVEQADRANRAELRELELQLDLLRGNRKAITGPIPIPNYRQGDEGNGQHEYR